MSDHAHEATDKLIAEAEKRVRKEYAQAAAEVEIKLDDYFRRFRIKDAAWRRMVVSGEKTKEQYAEWRQKRLMSGERWADMRDALANDYHDANVIARRVVDGYRAEAYVENHAYATYEVEREAQVDTSYTLYNRDAVERIIRENPELLPAPGHNMEERIAAGKDIRWQEGEIQSVILQGILQGDSLPDLSKRIAQRLGESNHNNTIRYARTAMGAAQNAGREDAFHRADEMGIVLERQWLATHDGRTRHSHRQMDYERRHVGEMFSNGCMYPCDPGGPADQIWNCFVGETKVASDSEIIRSYKHEYQGELITVKTAGGVNFTCTPNHPILTPRGWVAAHLLNDGDDLLVTFRSGRQGTPWVDPDIDHVFPSIGAFNNLADVSCRDRVSGLSVDFHGDRPASDVEIVSKERLLRNNVDSYCGQTVDKFRFINSGPFVFCKRHFMPRLSRVYIAALCFVRRACQSLAFFRSGLRHSDVHGFRTPTNLNVILSKYTIDNLPGETEVRGELLNGLSGNVFLDKVVSVKISSARCHVYNLQTNNGYYFVNSSIAQNKKKCNGIFAIAKNCRCTLRALIKGLEPQARKYRSEEIEGQTYEQWKAIRKRRSDPITKQEDIANAMKWRTINELYRGK